MTRHYVVPGRVELVGKHVDYAGGRSLTCAVDLVIEASATPLRDSVVRVSNADSRSNVVEVPLSADAARRPGRSATEHLRRSPWRAASRATFRTRRLASTSRLRSTLPASAGLSSSSALVVAIATALVDANDMERDPRWREEVPDAISRAPNISARWRPARHTATFPGDDGVGVRGGAQDHVAIVCAAAESVGQFSYLPARLERRVPWPAEYELVIGVSGVTATKTGNARVRYNRASDATRALVRAWNATAGRADDTLAEALASGADAPDRLARLAEAGIDDFPASYLVARLAQFREEIDTIVPGVGDALRDRDFEAIGRLVDRSQELAERALGNQVDETIHLARDARERGAVAASAFGAGFGGAVWAMLRSDDAATFADQWRGGYQTRFPERANDALWLRTRPFGPAREIAQSVAR